MFDKKKTIRKAIKKLESNISFSARSSVSISENSEGSRDTFFIRRKKFSTTVMNKSHSIGKKRVNRRKINGNDRNDSTKIIRSSKFSSGKMRRYSKSFKFNKLNTTTEK